MMLRKRNTNLRQNGDVKETQLDAKRKNNVAKKPTGKVEQRKPLVQVDNDESMQMEVDYVDPAPEYDFDKETADDPLAFALYANDIFMYFKHREKFFKVGDYFQHQLHFDNEARIRVVDWLVEVQEQFELNHETLYLGVKLMDMYLDRVLGVPLDQLQLVASAAVFVSAKFDERSPPLVDDFIYLANDSFTREEFLRMEAQLLLAVNFDLGAPISYSFLRRYSRVLKLEMPTLTLARYILETSLMFLDFCRVSESLMAVASLLLALRMSEIGDWTPILQKYSGYVQEDVEPLVVSLNHMLIKYRQEVKFADTIFKKYKHEIFFEVALVPSLDDKLSQALPIAPPEDLLVSA